MAFALGVLCEILATMVGTAGKQLVSYSAQAETKQARHFFKVFGLFITTLIGPVLDMTAYAFAPQAVIAPLNGLDIVWNTCTAPITLGEHLTSRHILGSSLVFVGAAATSVFGPHSAQQESLEWLQSTFFSMRFLSYLIVIGSLLGFSMLTLLRRPKGVGDKVRGIALGATAGGIAGNMFFISAGLGMFRSSASTGDWSAWQNWLPYVILLCGVLVAVGNIPFMTKGLQEYEALFMVTLFEGCHIVVACVSSAWVLGELEYTALGRCLLYWFFVGLIVTGLLIIRTTSAGQGRLPDLHEPASESRRPFRAASSPDSDTSDSEELGAAPGFVGCMSALASSDEEAQGARVSRAASRSSEQAPGAVVWASFSGIGSAHFTHPEEVPTESEDFTSEAAVDIGAEDGRRGKSQASIRE